MGFPPVLKKVQSPNDALNLIQANTQDALKQIVGPFLGGNLLTGISVGTSPTTISHKLGRQPQLWLIADQNTLATVKRTAWNTNTITLQASSACVISIWVN